MSTMSTMTEDERNKLDMMKSQKMDIDLVVDMLAEWFEDDAFHPDGCDSSDLIHGGWARVNQMVEKNQWELVSALYAREELETFRSVVSGNFTQKFMSWVPHYSVAYLEAMLAEYPLFVDMIQRALSDEDTRNQILEYLCEFEYDVKRIDGEYTTVKTSEPIWTDACTKKVKTIKCLEHVFTKKMIKNITTIQQNMDM